MSSQEKHAQITNDNDRSDHVALQWIQHNQSAKTHSKLETDCNDLCAAADGTKSPNPQHKN